MSPLSLFSRRGNTVTLSSRTPTTNRMRTPHLKQPHRTYSFFALVLCLCLLATFVQGATTPAAPLNLACQSGPNSGGVVLSFDASSTDGGEAILFYTVKYSTGSGAATTTYSSISPVQITSLTAGSSYAFQVAAVNPVGTSSYSNTVTCTAGTTPTIPYAASVSYNGSVTPTVATVSWAPPTSFGGMLALNYEIILLNATTLAQINDITVSSASSYDMKALSLGSYTWKMNAYSSIGSSSWTTYANFTLSASSTVPSAPRLTAWTPFSGGIQVAFEPPSYDGGSPILSYSLTVNGVVKTVGYASPLQAVATQGTTPTVTLYATNANGNSVAISTTTTTITGTLSPPPAPTGLTITMSTGSSVNVDWSHVDDLSSRVTSYLLYYGQRGNTKVAIGSTLITTANGVKPITVTGLCSGIYTFYVEAVGSVSDYGGMTSAPSTSVDYSSTGLKASVPTSVQALSSTNSISVFFAPPTSGSIPLLYSLTYFASSPQSTSGSSPIVATTNLFNGISQSFQLSAFTCLGPGDVYSFTATPATLVVVPSPVSATLLTATAGNSNATLTFTINSTATTNWISIYLISTLTIEGYQLYNSSQSPNSITIMGLTNGVSYTFYGIARSSGGPSPDSNSLSVQPYGPVQPVQNLTCISGLAVSSITCTWAAPSDSGGLSLQDYTVTWSSTSPPTSGAGSQTPASSGLTSKTLTGLVAGVDYTVSVTSNTLKSTGAAVTVVVRAAKEPTAPSIACTDTANSITVTISAPSDLGGEYLKYYILTDTLSGVTTTYNMTLNTTKTFTGLNNGDQHDYSVKAYNDAGASSAATVSCTAAIPPDCPSALTLVSGPTVVGEISANWSSVPTSNNGGSVVTGYTLEWIAADSTVKTLALVGINNRSWSITNLIDDGVYQVGVYATNRKGDSSGCTFTSIQASGTPDKPVISSIIPQNGGLILNLVANPSNQTGGVTLSGYECTLSTGVVTKLYSDSTPFLVSGLTNGVSYSVTCTVNNTVGARSSASAVVSGVPANVPNPTTNVTLTSGVGSGQIYITWTPPTFNGGSAITAFRVAYHLANDTNKNGTVDVPITPYAYQLTGLTANLTYNVTVLAVNVVGASSIGVNSSATALAGSVPCAVSNVVATPGNQQIGVTWSAPSCNGGIAITTYYISATKNTTGASVTYSQSSSSATSFTFTGLTNGVYYIIRVYATNTAGNSTAAPSPNLLALPSTTPAAPTLSGTSSGNTYISLTLSAPANTGGLSITSYSCYYNISTVSPTSYTQSPNTFTATGPFIINGLTNGQNYSFACTCSNSNGASPISTTVYGVPSSVPDPPINLVLLSGPSLGQINATWSAPVWNGGLALTGYNVSWTDFTTHFGYTIVSASTFQYTLTSLIPNTTYFVAIQAMNQVGSSPTMTGLGLSNAGYQLSANVPCPPYSPTYTRASQSVVASWSTPTCDGGLTIQYYYLYLQVTDQGAGPITNGQAWTVPILASSLTLTVTNLTNGWVYSAQMSAANSIGNSSLTSLASFQPATVPSAPTSFSCKSGPTVSGSITVNWAQPTNLGGVLTISSYNFTYTDLSNNNQFIVQCINVFQCTNYQLTPRTNYSVVAYAITDVGVGASTTPQYCTAAAVPDTISPISCLGTDQTITLKFTAPWTNLVLQNYLVNYTGTSNVTLSKSFSPSLSTPVSLALTSLTNEVQYSVVVYACNLAGCSSGSTPLVCAAGQPPNVPTSVVATPYNTQIVVTYGPPATPAGSPVQSYVGYLIPSGALVSSSGYSLTFSNLNLATSYTILLWASNAYGVSANVTLSVTTLQILPPDNMLAFEPEFDSASPTCLVYFTPAPQRPSSTSFATNFTVSYRLFATSNPWIDVSSTSIPISVSGLSASASYAMKILARNSYASSAYTVEFTCITGQTNYQNQPDAPSIVAGPGSNQSVIAIHAPADTGGSPMTPILNYYIYTSGKGGSTSTPVPHASVPTINDVTFGTLYGLINGYQYYHYVICNNGLVQQQYVPISVPSVVVTTLPSATYTIPSTPTQASISMIPGDSEVTFTINTPPTSNTPLLGYLVQWPVTTTNVPVSGGSSMSNSTTTIVTTGNLVNGVPTYFQLQAVNGAGYSNNLFTNPAVRPGILPGPPIAVIGSPRNQSATVFFQPPLSGGSNPITNYYVYYLDRPSSTAPEQGTSSPIYVTGLTNGIVSNFSICSVSAVSPTGVPLWQSGYAPSSCVNFTVIAFPTVFPALNGSLIFTKSVTSLPTTGVAGLDSLCLGALPYSHALVCDSVTGRTMPNSFWYHPTDTPVYAFNPFLFAGSDYSPIAASSVDLFATGIQTSTSFAPNFTNFFQGVSNPIGVKNGATTLAANFATDRAFTGCLADGSIDATRQCSGWTLGSGSVAAVDTGRDYSLSSAADYSTNWVNDAIGGTCGDYNKFIYCVWFPSAEDGIQNGDETGVDCGGTTLFYDGSVAYPCIVPPPTLQCPASISFPTSIGLNTAALVLPTVNVTSLIKYTLTFSYTSPIVGVATDGNLLDVLRSPWMIQGLLVDGKGQQATCTLPVYILDQEAPRITCPGTVSAITDRGFNYATHVSWVTPNGTNIFDNVGITYVTPVPPVTTQFPIGTNNYTLYAKDAAGNVGNCTFLIIVTDPEPPTITFCPANFVQSTDPGQNYATLSYPAPTATDNVGLLISNGTLVQGYLNGARIYVNTASGVQNVPIRIQFQDLSGNKQDCAFVVNVTDREPPAVVCPANYYTVTDPGLSTKVVELQQGQVSDNVNLTNVLTAPQFAVGVSYVKLVATDEIGNVNSCSYFVNVADVEPPVLTCPANMTVQLGSGIYLGPIYWPTPIMIDNVAVVKYDSNHKSGDMFPITADTIITYNATDAAGNTGYCSFSLTVLGSLNTPQPASGLADPSIQCPPDIIQYATYASAPPSSVVTWSGPSIVNSHYVLAVSGNALNLNNTLFSEGTTYVTYTLSDFINISTSCTFRVTIIQLTPIPSYPPSRAQITMNLITTDVLTFQKSLLTDVSQSMAIDIQRVSVVVVVAGYSSTDVVLEFTPNPATYYASHTGGRRRLLASSTTLEASDLLYQFQQQLQTSNSPLLTSTSGKSILPATFVNCSDSTTAAGVTRALHCPAPNGTAILTCPLGCTPDALCYEKASSLVSSSSSVPYYREPWFTVLITCLCWIVLLVILFFCGCLGRQAVVSHRPKSIVSVPDETLVVAWPESTRAHPNLHLSLQDLNTNFHSSATQLSHRERFEVLMASPLAINSPNQQSPLDHHQQSLASPNILDEDLHTATIGPISDYPTSSPHAATEGRMNYRTNLNADFEGFSDGSNFHPTYSRAGSTYGATTDYPPPTNKYY